MLSVGKGHSRGPTGIEMWWHGGGPGPREAANDGTSGPAAQAPCQPTDQTLLLKFWHSSPPHNTAVGHINSHGTRATDHSLLKRKIGCTTEQHAEPATSGTQPPRGAPQAKTKTARHYHYQRSAK